MTMQEAAPTEGRMVTSASIPREPRLGYCRGVRVGNPILIAGTAAVDGQDRIQEITATAVTAT